MNTPNSVGLFGKLPAHGDFIYRALPTNFINLWDSWLQGFVGCSQEQLGEAWLDIYLTSPIWRFAFSEGVIDQNLWAGIVLPSVDRVGRYFPFSIIARVPATANPLEIISQSTWYESIEALALKALDGQLPIDDLLVEINQCALDSKIIYTQSHSLPAKMGTVIAIDYDAPSPAIAVPALFNSLLRENLSSYSVWSTQGSNYVEPCFFYCRNLPPMQGIAAMMDGHWSTRGWSEPCALHTVQQSS